MREKQVVDSTICSKSWPVVGSTTGSPAAKAIRKQLRKKCASIEIRHNDKYNWFKLSFTVPIDRENPDHKLCSVLLESRWILISSKDRQTDYCATATFPETCEGYFYGQRADSQPFESEKLFNLFRADIAKLQHFPVGGVRHFSNSRPKKDQKLALTKSTRFRDEWTSDLTSPPPKTRPGCFHDNPIEIQEFLKKWIPIGSESTNRISAEWTADSDSAPPKTYRDTLSTWKRNSAIPLVGNRGGSLGGGKDLKFPGKK